MLDLNAEQLEAVNHLNGPCLVTATPGSGKTFCLVSRIVNLIKLGIDEKNILCLTFTNKAANEMKQRIQKSLGRKDLNFFIGTFHGLCVRLLRKIGPYCNYSKDFIIVDDREQIDLILQISRKLGFDIEKADALKISYHLNYFRNQMLDMSWLEHNLRIDSLVKIAKEYLSVCRKNYFVDFSGLLYDTIELLEKNSKIKESIQNSFKYILIDETQDTNVSQFYLLNLLGEKWKNIMLIGDLDQAIFGFQGARYENISDFLNIHKDCRQIILSTNYRSTPEIIQASSNLIRHNSNHIEKDFKTNNKSGEPVRCFSFGNQILEAQWIGKTIKNLIDKGKWKPSDIAVLYRVNKMSEPIEQALVNNGVPYSVTGSHNFYDRREIKDCMSMLKFLINKKDGIAFHRLSGFVGGIGNVSVGKIEKIAEEKDISMLEACKEFSNDLKSVKTKKACDKIIEAYNDNYNTDNPPECLNKLITKFNYSEYIQKELSDTFIERNENIQQLIESSSEFSNIYDYVQQTSLITNNDKKSEEGKVSLMSIHSAKGLEFEIVFAIGMEDGIIPHRQTIAEDMYGGLSEERRLAFVCFSRSKKILITTWCRRRKRFGQGGKMTENKSHPSPFLKEAGLEVK